MKPNLYRFLAVCRLPAFTYAKPFVVPKKRQIRQIRQASFDKTLMSERIDHHMNCKISWSGCASIAIVAMALLGMSVHLLEAQSSSCPCWDIDEVLQKTSGIRIPCQARPEEGIRSGGGATIGTALAQRLTKNKSFRLEVYDLEVNGQHQAWCSCFSNPRFDTCSEGKIEDLSRSEGQACIDEVTRLCEERQ